MSVRKIEEVFLVIALANLRVRCRGQWKFAWNAQLESVVVVVETLVVVDVSL